MWAPVDVGYRPHVRNPSVIALCLGALVVLSGCPGNAGTNPPQQPAAETNTPTGEPLELNNTEPAKAGACAECTKPAGTAHVCGKSEWCATCKTDIAAGAAQHVCNVSHFCKNCGVEAAIAGHRCGETRFDKASLSAADLDEQWEEFDQGEDEDE